MEMLMKVKMNKDMKAGNIVPKPVHIGLSTEKVTWTVMHTIL